MLAFPISMIVEKFATAQQRAIEDQQIQQGKRIRDQKLFVRFSDEPDDIIL